MTSNMRSIYEDVNYYFKSLGLFLSRAKTCINDLGNRQWLELLTDLSFDADKEIRLLTIGTGKGDRDCLLIQHLSKRYNKLHVTVVEPAKRQLDEFKNKAAKITEDFPGVSFEWHVKMFEDYQNDHKKPDGTFHIVFAGHSLIYMKNWESALDGMYNHVQPGGMLAVTVVHGQGFQGRLRKMYRDLEGCSLHLQTSDDVKRHLKTKNIEHLNEKELSREVDFDISDVFDESSDDGNVLLDFLVLRSQFRKTAPPDHQAKVLKFLRDNSVKENGRHWLHSGEEHVAARRL
ncbi:histamine N-methyltransferase-like [Saccoglossus kowalevskii]|uniref:Histamine N-methyltransferase-like n=1 Tax=Saccoglossus kowalevskii TaxID=10224 RepID=A0ABM0ME75_SACKO|nr:PREDICTED: histamine N-methyltransferase-like [Saccoglossus kowalevskii]